jgi:predicted RNA methylase
VPRGGLVQAASMRHVSVIARALPGVCKRHGVRRGLRLALHEVVFDLVHHTDTSIERAEAHRPTAAHEACNPLIFTELIRHVPFDEHSAFVDFGSGKGRALLLAAEHGLRRVTGVELSPAYCRIADGNVERFAKGRPGQRIAVVCADAAQFRVPGDVNVALVFDPFGLETVRAVLDRIADSLMQAPRDFYVIYMHPRFASEFMRNGFQIVHDQGGDGMVLHRVA